MRDKFYIFFLLLSNLGTGCAKSGSNGIFKLDVSKPYVIVLGRGSALRGLETIDIDEIGHAKIHRLKDIGLNTWEHASVYLSPELLDRLGKALAENKIIALRDKYHNSNIKDGSQWILYIRQGISEKTVFFDNEFPSPIVKFAEEFNAIMGSAGILMAKWENIDAINIRDHETKLWNAIKH